MKSKSISLLPARRSSRTRKDSLPRIVEAPFSEHYMHFEQKEFIAMIVSVALASIHSKEADSSF
jgi:hypothetical protein